MDAELKSCPFCGSADIDAEGWTNSEGAKGPACNDCNGSAGMISQSHEDNIAAWNTRHSQNINQELLGALKMVRKRCYSTAAGAFASTEIDQINRAITRAGALDVGVDQQTKD